HSHRLDGCNCACAERQPTAIGQGDSQGFQQDLLGPIEAENGTSADSGWVTILCNNIKTANMKDLFITAALEVGIETETASPPETESKAKIEVRVLRDGQEVEPGVVVYGKREQELELSAGAQTAELELETLDAASFSFVDVDVPVGVHQ